MRIDTNKFDSVTRSLMQKLAIYQMKTYAQAVLPDFYIKIYELFELTMP